MIKYIKYLVFILLIVFAYSCQKEESLKPREDLLGAQEFDINIPADSLPGSGGGTGGGGTGGGTGGGSSDPEFFNFSVDGVNYSNTTPFYSESGILAQMLSSLTSVDNSMQLTVFTNVSVPDTTIFDEFSFSASFNKTASASYSAIKGMMIITELNADKIVGTVNFVGEGPLGVSDTVVVTNGRFSVNR